ncbi:TPA: hypothetical protein U9M35_002877 [Acinetobacter baumannii]|nr:hypothetical protein [Acinetobacter baumannii]
MTEKTAEVELSGEKATLVLKLIDRANRLGDEIKFLQSIIKLKGHSERELNLLHDELDVVRDYREITLERIAVITLGDQSKLNPNHPDYQPVGLGSLGELDDEEVKLIDGWEAARSAMFEASKK